MPDTTNFGWTMPVEDGSSGAWDTILNDLFEDIDTDLQTVKDNADNAAAENIAFPPIMCAAMAKIHGGGYAETGIERNIFDGVGPTEGQGPSGSTVILSSAFFVPIQGLKPGMRITGFKTRGIAPAGSTMAVSLRSQGYNETFAVLSSEVSHGSSAATLTLSGLSVTVQADTHYFFYASFSRDDVNVQPRWFLVQPIVDRG